ncbi:MAG: hypothetical protein KAR45_13600, partial [Desulfobacteraceae bacterium]|nr:hypothetical protein [Desulfobacteraceae bacterium]
ITAAVPDATPDEIGQAIDKIKAENPNWTMDQVFEAAIKQLNPNCDDKTINEIRNSWQEFTGVSDLSKDDISQILASPLGFVLKDEGTSETSVKNLIALLMLLMIEIAGEESANQLLEGCKQRDSIMEIAKEKASDIRMKAVVNLVIGLCSAAVQIGASAAAMSSASKGMTAAKAGNMGLSTAYGAQGSAQAGIGQGLSTACNAIGGLITGLIDANIALLDGESQVASTNKDIADKLRQKATELMQSCLKLLESMSQADYQTMTAIGRV